MLRLVLVLLLAVPVMAAVPAGFSDTLVTNIGGPTALAFTPDGRLLVSRQAGSLHVIQNGTLLATPAITFGSTTICSNSERGLLGIAVDPAFASNGHLYLFRTFRTAAGACVNRVSRFTMSGNTISAPLVVTVEPEATSRLRPVSSGLVHDPAQDRFVGELTLTNIGAVDVFGPLYVVIQGLPEVSFAGPSYQRRSCGSVIDRSSRGVESCRTARRST